MFVNLVVFLKIKRGAVSSSYILIADSCSTLFYRYFPDDIGSGSHAHLSLWENGRNVFMGSAESKTPYGMSKIGEHFMAGVLHHLPSILAFIAPLPNRSVSLFYKLTFNNLSQDND